MASLAHHLRAIEAVAGQVQSPGRFERCAEPFDALVRDHRCIHEVLDRTLGYMLDKTGYSPRELGVQWRSDGVKLATQIAIESRSTFTLVASLQHAASRSAFSAPGSIHMAVVSDKPLAYDLYALPARYDNEVFQELQLEHLGRRRLEPLTSAFIDASRHVVVFEDSDEATILKLQSPFTYPFEWAFDLESLRAWQVTSTILEDTQLVHICEAIAALGAAKHAGPLEQALAHPRHHVRWSALQAIARLDGRRARPHLESAVSDRHPHIRAAARFALERLPPAQTA